tara:strand:- start:2392 stop:3162 length:771 start_codon:yes stop_codon:yes gene_type:complete
MNKIECQELHLRLDDWLDSALGLSTEHALEMHALECAPCGVMVRRERQMRAALSALPAPAPRPGFVAEALRNARMADRAPEASGSHGSGNWMMAFSGAAVASSCFAIALWVWQPNGRIGAEPATPNRLATVAAMPVSQVAQVAARANLQTVALSIGKVESMRLRIEAPRNFSEVNFSVDLPEHVELAGQPGIRAITWKGALNKGDNILDLPLVASGEASGVLEARVNWGQFERRIETSIVGVPEARVPGSPLRRGI